MPTRDQPSDARPGHRHAQLLPAGLAWAMALAVLAGAAIVVAGGPSLAPVALVEALARWIGAGSFAIAMVVSGLGLGLLLARVWKGARGLPLSVTWALGLGALLTLSHLAGVLGGLREGAVGVGFAWLLVLPGLIAALASTRGVREAPRRWWTGSGAGRGLLLLGFAGLGCVLAMSASTPGLLWASEFGGYDALSYHLQLPREWLALGRVTPLDHNVYSFLPGYTSAAFAHLSLLGSVLNPGMNADLLAGDGRGLFAAQMFHALLACLACAACGGLTREACVRLGADGRVGDALAACGFALAACAPWVLVTGSLAYNEMAVVLFGAAALRAALLERPSLGARGVLVGVLVGLACCVKPTALLLLAPGAGLLLLTGATARVRAMSAPLALAALAGLLTIIPWLVRNAIASGNPVFPFAPGLFAREDGSMGHWSAEQVQRFADAHRFDGSLAQRLALTILPDARDPAGVVHRGLMHPQWGLTLILACVAGAVLMVLALRAPPAARRIGLSLAAGWWITLLAWLFTTHVQSRFLLPALPLACAVLVATTVLLAPAARRHAATAVLALVLVLAGAWRAAPMLGLTSVGLVLSPDDRAGDAARLRATSLWEQPGQWTPEQWINNRLGPSDRVLLVGDATPLYLRVPIRWATTYDTNPLASVVRFAPNDPRRWAPALRELGISHVLINASELARLERSGFLDPALGPARIIPWASGSLRPLRVWDETGQALFEVPAAAR